MKIKINGLVWTVKNEDANHPDLQNSRGNPCFGVTDYTKQTITLRNDMSKELYRQTVAHELLHAYTFSFGVHLFADEETEEPVADFIGSHIDKIWEHTNKICNELFGKGVK